MISESDIYWLTRLDGIKAVLHAATFFSTMVCLFGLIPLIGTHIDKDFQSCRKMLRWLWAASAFVMILSTTAYVLTPTTKEMCAIRVLPLIANSEEVQGLGEDIVALAREWVKEMRPKNPEQTPEAAQKAGR